MAEDWEVPPLPATTPLTDGGGLTPPLGKEADSDVETVPVWLIAGNPLAMRGNLEVTGGG